MTGNNEEQGGSNGSYYKLTKLDHLLPSWESLVTVDRRVTYRKDENDSLQYENCVNATSFCLSCFRDLTAVMSVTEIWFSTFTRTTKLSNTSSVVFLEVLGDKCRFLTSRVSLRFLMSQFISREGFMARKKVMKF